MSCSPPAATARCARSPRACAAPGSPLALLPVRHRQPARAQPRTSRSTQLAASVAHRVHRRRPRHRHGVIELERADRSRETPRLRRDGRPRPRRQDDREHPARAEEAGRLARLRRRDRPVDARQREDPDALPPRRRRGARHERAHDPGRQLRPAARQRAAAAGCRSRRRPVRHRHAAAGGLRRLGADLGQDRVGERRAAPQLGRPPARGPRRARCARCATCAAAGSACDSIAPRTSSSTATTSAWCSPSTPGWIRRR